LFGYSKLDIYLFIYGIIVVKQCLLWRVFIDLSMPLKHILATKWTPTGKGSLGVYVPDSF